MHAEAVPTETSSEGAGKWPQDPTLLGVSLPIHTTVTAATQIKEAWATALVELLAAAKAKAKAKAPRAGVGKAKNGSASPPDITA